MDLVTKGFQAIQVVTSDDVAPGAQYTQLSLKDPVATADGQLPRLRMYVSDRPEGHDSAACMADCCGDRMQLLPHDTHAYRSFTECTQGVRTGDAQQTRSGLHWPHQRLLRKVLTVKPKPIVAGMQIPQHHHVGTVQRTSTSETRSTRNGRRRGH